MIADDSIRITIAHPHLSQPLGCDGNAYVLASRAERSGFSVSVTRGQGTGMLPEADIYLISGVPTGDQVELTELLRSDDSFVERVRSGSVVLAVNSGFEVLGETFETIEGTTHRGLGLVDFAIHRDSFVEGPVVTIPGGTLNLPAMSGFEVHSGRCVLGDGVEPLARVEIGVGNGDDLRSDGVVSGHVVGTYMHGPILARNPELADILLKWALGRSFEPIEKGIAGELRRQRIEEDRADPTGWGGREYGSVPLGSRIRRLLHRC